MERNILSKSEDNSFSLRVVKYNNLSIKDDAEEAYIKKRTKELIYKILRDVLMAPDEIISSVYLNMHYDIEKVISAYRIATKSYNHYLKQVIIYRIRRVRKKEAVEHYLEYECAMDGSVGDDEAFNFSDERGKTSLSSPVSLKYSNMGMKEVIEHIMNKEDRMEHPLNNKKEKAVSMRLDYDRVFRRNLLFLILSLPFSNDESDAANYARLYKTDENAFMRLMHLKNEIIERNSKNRELNREKANKHWALMAKIKNSMYKASTKEEYNALKENYMAHVRCHKNRLADFNRTLGGIVHEEIATMTGQSRTTVTMGIKRVKEILRAITLSSSG